MKELSASNDHIIAKGKRTKRPRPSSSSSSASDVTSNFSPTTSTGISSSAEEDEDLANCLILLARGNRKDGVNVYECKTCTRTFPSFQALGGHRASHKKPKPAPQFNQEDEFEEEEEEESKFVKINTITLSPSRPKIHECSICGSEFSSGQALGGHMRRHRSGHNTPRNMLSLDLNLPAPIEEAEFHAGGLSLLRGLTILI
ncbi:zinc finger protein ZAT5-like [Salvia hispanica]|uniref:zinc finger protein ZAT5-like n=1 Tax=Salvia hispanica TaxID=49212 RepID=UPI00200922E4|nr:zinc finger protein ZAT5-like [Salvia hispanica]